MAHVYTLGIEEEFQIVDKTSLELRSHMMQIVEGSKLILKEQVKSEMHQSVVETGTTICQDIEQARSEVLNLRRTIADLAAKSDLLIAAAGTHPFSSWTTQAITEDERYNSIVDELQDTARSNLIFGLHVHVGIKNRERGIQLMNAVRYFLPHIYALSANSPFWEGRNTGFLSFRSKVFERFPRTGIPEFFNNATEYDRFVSLLVKTGCIDNAKKIWWDIRLHPVFETLEFRICDMPMRVDETIALAALMQALIAKLDRLMDNNLTFRMYRRPLINENKWRAARYGLRGKMIDFGKETEVPVTDLVYELLEFVDEVVDDLGSRHEINYIHKIIERGTGAERQLREYDQNQSLTNVMTYIVEETYKGL